MVRDDIKRRYMIQIEDHIDIIQDEPKKNKDNYDFE